MGNEKILFGDSGDLPKPDVAQIEDQTSTEAVDVEIDAQLSRKLDHKFDRHIIPWIFGIW